jgi:hypothetical protein
MDMNAYPGLSLVGLAVTFELFSKAFLHIQQK